MLRETVTVTFGEGNLAAKAAREYFNFDRNMEYENTVVHNFPWQWFCAHSSTDLLTVFTRDFVTLVNHYQIIVVCGFPDN